ncbi:unnamed protein product [Candidula unifasciata]|uniref:Uncharacterized protein n=1 Tax=Candidula unifasciata TaxID=100452 RepID=A0A8S3ZTX0_9EUPU|nr:unnamed protein product [Candidula unifasciata]
MVYKCDHTSNMVYKCGHISNMVYKCDHTSNIVYKCDHINNMVYKCDHTSNMVYKCGHISNMVYKCDHTTNMVYKCDHINNMVYKCDHINNMVYKCDHISNMVYKCDHINNMFSRDKVMDVESCPGRKLVLAADGSSGQSARLLGLKVNSIPLSERRVHGLLFDLSAYGVDLVDTDTSTGFSLKLFGSSRHRYMSLAVPKTDSSLVRHMRLVLDRSMMRNIFVKCFNACKWPVEAQLEDAWAWKHLQFSPRLFDIKLFQRLETVAYFQDSNMFVMAEGEAARCCNFHTGLDVNMAIAGLSTLAATIRLAACALTDFDITNVMVIKSQHSQSLAKQFLKTGLKHDMFSHHY